MTQRCVTDIRAGDHFYITDDLSELCDILEYYPIEVAVDPHIIVGKLALILATPNLSSEEWDGCIMLSFGSVNNHYKLPVAALDMCRTYSENEEEVGKDKRIRNSYGPFNDLDLTPSKNLLTTDDTFSPKARNRWNNILSPSSSAAVKRIFFDHSESDSLKQKDIICIRDSSSETAMIRQLAAETIQDAYR